MTDASLTDSAAAPKHHTRSRSVRDWHSWRRPAQRQGEGRGSGTAIPKEQSPSSPQSSSRLMVRLGQVPVTSTAFWPPACSSCEMPPPKMKAKLHILHKVWGPQALGCPWSISQSTQKRAPCPSHVPGCQCVPCHRAGCHHSIPGTPVRWEHNLWGQAQGFHGTHSLGFSIHHWPSHSWKRHRAVTTWDRAPVLPGSDCPTGSAHAMPTQWRGTICLRRGSSNHKGWPQHFKCDQAGLWLCERGRKKEFWGQYRLWRILLR